MSVVPSTTEIDFGSNYSFADVTKDKTEETVPTSTDRKNEHFETIFTEKGIRLGFIRKVFGIFFLQISTSLGIIALVNCIQPVRDYTNSNIGPCIIPPLVIASLLFLLLVLAPTLPKKVPVNFVLLAIFTGLIGFAVGVVATQTEFRYVVYAAGMILVPCGLSTLYTFQNKFDLRWYSHLILVTLPVAMGTGVIYWTSLPQEWNPLCIACVGSFVAAGYLVIFVHCVMAQKCSCFHADEESYVVVALWAYAVVIAVLLVVIMGQGGGCRSTGGHGGVGGCFCGGTKPPRYGNDETA